jgi:hypothetical protein
LLTIVFIIGEYRWRKGVINKLEFNTTEVGGEKSMLLDYINHEIYDKLPEFTWEEVNERVQRGVSTYIYLVYLSKCENFFNLNQIYIYILCRHPWLYAID